MVQAVSVKVESEKSRSEIFQSEDGVNYVDDTLSGLMTMSMGEQSTTQKENHCTIESEVCLVSEKLLSYRSVDDDCEGGDEAGEGVLKQLQGDNIVDRDCRHQTSADERLRGHPHYFC